MECQFLSHWYDSTPKKSRHKRDSNPGSSALEADALPLGQRGGANLSGVTPLTSKSIDLLFHLSCPTPGVVTSVRSGRPGVSILRLFSIKRFTPELLTSQNNASPVFWRLFVLVCKSGLALDGIYYHGKPRTTRSGGSWL